MPRQKDAETIGAKKQNAHPAWLPPQRQCIKDRSHRRTRPCLTPKRGSSRAANRLLLSAEIAADQGRIAKTSIAEKQLSAQVVKFYVEQLSPRRRRG